MKVTTTFSANTKIKSAEMNTNFADTRSFWTQSVTTNTLLSSQEIYRGWGYTGNFGAPTGDVTVTLPNSGFDDAAYDIFPVYLGEKATTPASRNDATSFKAGATVIIGVAAGTSATAFSLRFSSNGGGNFAIVLFSWIAIGTKA